MTKKLSLGYKLSHFWESRGRFVFLGFGVGLVVLGFGIMTTSVLEETKEPEVEFLPSPVPEKIVGKLIVNVAGAVKRPGVYQLEEGSRINQAILQAGGFREEADLSWVNRQLNLAKPLLDGEKIYIPFQGEDFSQSIAEGSVAGSTASGLINLNTATLSDLQTLPGIGASFAERIIEYREANNGFKTVEEIQAVSGIGGKTFEKIKDKITL